MANNLNQLYIEISARAKIVSGPDEANIDGIVCHVFRFDLMHVFGDFEVVTIPAAFSSEEAARVVLYQKLVGR